MAQSEGCWALCSKPLRPGAAPERTLWGHRANCQWEPEVAGTVPGRPESVRTRIPPAGGGLPTSPSPANDKTTQLAEFQPNSAPAPFANLLASRQRKPGTRPRESGGSLTGKLSRLHSDPPVCSARRPASGLQPSAPSQSQRPRGCCEGPRGDARPAPSTAEALGERCHCGARRRRRPLAPALGAGRQMADVGVTCVET